jgi:hypothetical protein
MIEIKSIQDIKTQRGKIDNSILEFVEETLKDWIENYKKLDTLFDPDEHGYILLIQSKNDLNELEELNIDLSDSIFESIELVNLADKEIYNLFVLCNNEFGYGIIIPKEDWLNEEILNNLNSYLEIDKKAMDDVKCMMEQISIDNLHDLEEEFIETLSDEGIEELNFESRSSDSEFIDEIGDDGLDDLDSD